MNKRKNIFILNDIQLILSRMKTFLNRKEYDEYAVFEASNLNKLFNLLSNNSYNASLIIIDIDLKSENGLEIIKKVRELNKLVPIIILTSNNKKDLFIKGVAAGTSDYLLKPYDDSILNSKVLKLLALENQSDNILIFNLAFFLKTQFIKFNNNNLLIMMTTFFKPIQAY